MKVLLLNPPKDHEFSLFVLEDYNKVARSNQVPIWALYLHSYLKDEHDVEIIDMNAKELPINSIDLFIKSFKPDVIGISCVIAKWLTVKALAKEIKTHCDIPIVVGGVHASLYPWEVLQCQDIDYVIQGFGQKPLAELLDAITWRLGTHNIERVFTKKNCPEKIKGCFMFENVDDYPMPDRSVLPIEDYKLPYIGEGPATSMVTSFGCPYKCKFCRCKGFKPLIIRDVGHITAEMTHIESLGIKNVIFNDELFTINTKRIKEICNAIIDAGINLKWSVRSRANLVNKDSLELMKRAGCVSIHLGIESGNDRILELMNKKINVEMIRKSVAMIKSVGLNVSASFMLGYLDETKEEIKNTVAFAKELELNNSQFFVTQPESETELYDELKKLKNLPDDIYSDFTLDTEGVNLKDNVASLHFDKQQMEDFLRYAYSEVDKNLYNIKKNS